MTSRAKSIKKQWDKFRKDNDQNGRSYLNIGRMPLIWFLKYCYNQYTKLCYLTGEPIAPFSNWLTEKVDQS